LPILEKLKNAVETEQPYLSNLAELAATISVPPRLKLDIVIPGRRFLQSAVFQQQGAGRFKKSQLLVFLFNDLLLFTQVKDTKRLSSGTISPQLFQKMSSPRGRTKNKVVEYMYLENLIIIDKGNNLIEFTAIGLSKHVVVGVDDLKVKQEWLKNLRAQVTIWKLQKGIIEKKELTVEKKEKKERTITDSDKPQRRERSSGVITSGGEVGDKKKICLFQTLIKKKKKKKGKKIGILTLSYAYKLYDNVIYTCVVFWKEDEGKKYFVNCLL